MKKLVRIYESISVAFVVFGMVLSWGIAAGPVKAGEKSQIPAAAPDASYLVSGAFNYMRGKASISMVNMTIQRPDWRRTMTINAWTRGESESLFIITAPPKDNGNGTLKKGKQMWMFNPKVNRVIKLPPSMMAQAWQGSDFSNNDLAKSDTLIRDYDHSTEKVELMDGIRVYQIKSLPKPEAPVVWGMLRLTIREDLILLRQEFFDEDLSLVKTMSTGNLRLMGGKLFPQRWKMQKTDRPEAFTLLEYGDIAFEEGLPTRVFTLGNLQNPRR